MVDTAKSYDELRDTGAFCMGRDFSCIREYFKPAGARVVILCIEITSRSVLRLDRVIECVKMPAEYCILFYPCQLKG